MIRTLANKRFLLNLTSKDIALDQTEKIVTGANLASLDAGYADLRDIQFLNTNLESANFQGAILDGASFTGSNLYLATFTDASARNCDFQDAKALTASQFRNADLTSAKLPESIHFDLLDNVAETCKTAGSIHSLLLGACIYCLVTIGTSKDVNLITNATSTPLPVINAPVPLVGFYMVAPILLLVLYIYFHLYLTDLWTKLALLPGRFPDGLVLNQKCYPWLVSTLIEHRDSTLCKQRSSPLFFIKVFVIAVTAWLAVPITLAAFWARYLNTHDTVGTSIQTSIICLTILVGLISYQSAMDRLSGKVFGKWDWATQKLPIYTISIFACAAALTFVSKQICEGTVDFAKTVSANIVGDDVSVKPDKWNGKLDMLAMVKGAQLEFRNLKFAKGSGAFLVNANLTYADLQAAQLTETDMRGALLSNANFNFAEMLGANLSFAKLKHATFKGATISLSNFSYTLSDYSKASGADAWSYRQQALLQQASREAENAKRRGELPKNAENALILPNFTEASEGAAWVLGVTLDMGSLLDMSDCTAVDVDFSHAVLPKSEFHHAVLSKSNFSHATLKGSNFSEADASDCNFADADLSNCDFTNADLSHAKFDRATLKGTVFAGAKGIDVSKLLKHPGSARHSK